MWITTWANACTHAFQVFCWLQSPSTHVGLNAWGEGKGEGAKVPPSQPEQRTTEHIFDH